MRLLSVQRMRAGIDGLKLSNMEKGKGKTEVKESREIKGN